MEGLLRMDAAGLTPMLRCVVHDEVVLSAPAAAYDEVGRLVLECLSFEWARLELPVRSRSLQSWVVDRLPTGPRPTHDADQEVRLAPAP